MRSKSVQKCSTAQSFTFPKFTSFKLGTLDLDSKCKERYRTVLQILMHRNICAKILIIIDRSNLKSTLVSLKYPSFFILPTDYGHPERKWPSLHGRKFTPTPKFLGTAEPDFVCHIGLIFQISLIYAFIGCP